MAIINFSQQLPDCFITIGEKTMNIIMNFVVFSSFK